MYAKKIHQFLSSTKNDAQKKNWPHGVYALGLYKRNVLLTHKNNSRNASTNNYSERSTNQRAACTQFQQSFLRVPTATVLAFLRKTKNLHIPYPTTMQNCGSSILVTNSA